MQVVYSYLLSIAVFGDTLSFMGAAGSGLIAAGVLLVNARNNSGSSAAPADAVRDAAAGGAGSMISLAVLRAPGGGYQAVRGRDDSAEEEAGGEEGSGSSGRGVGGEPDGVVPLALERRITSQQQEVASEVVHHNSHAAHPSSHAVHHTSSQAGVLSRSPERAPPSSPDLQRLHPSATPAIVHRQPG